MRFRVYNRPYQSQKLDVGVRRRGVNRTDTNNPLVAKGWSPTRAGRWIDPQTKRSHTAPEAWAIINERE